MAKLGRPRKADEDRLSVNLTIRITSNDQQRFKRAAGQRDISEWLRNLGRKAVTEQAVQ